MRPLKVLHIANRGEKKQSRQFYSFQHKVNNGLVRNGHNVLWFSDRDIARGLNPLRSQKLGKKACNRELIDVSGHFKPDVLLLSQADLISAETISTIRTHNPSLRVAQYNIDGLITRNNLNKIHSKAEVVDFTFMTTAGEALKRAAGNGSGAAFIPNPVDPSVEINKAYLSDHLPIDVFFAGRLSDMSDDTDIRNSIGRLTYDLPALNIKISRSLWGANYIDCLGRSRMGLSLSTLPGHYTAEDAGVLEMCSSDRISHYMGNGLLTISNRIFGMSRLYGEECLVEVDSYDSLVRAIEQMMEEPESCKKIARAGHEKVMAHFNARLVAQFMIEVLLEGGARTPYAWPTEVWRSP